MSTWHQQKGMREGRTPTTFSHPELYTVVEDGPNAHLCVSRFKDPVDAQRHLDRIKPKLPFSHILPPSAGRAKP